MAWSTCVRQRQQPPDELVSRIEGVPLSTVGVVQAGGRWRYALRAVLLLAIASGAAGSQTRVIERHEPDEPEGRLLAFYAAAVAFSPAAFADGESRLSLGVELSYVPWLDAAQRRPSIDKPEATNLAPVFPRPRVALRLGGVLAEASWIPPMPLFDVRANLFGFSATGTVLRVGGTSLAPRLWLTTGRIRGAMTCNEDTMLGHGLELQTYYATVCRGRESDDWFEPRLLGGELVASRAVGSGGVRAYVLAGARYDRTRFDIGVRMPDGSRDPDHPILELRTTRPHFALGTTWRGPARWGAGLEGFYAPGSLFTARVSARYAWRP